MKGFKVEKAKGDSIKESREIGFYSQVPSTRVDVERLRLILEGFEDRPNMIEDTLKISFSFVINQFHPSFIHADLKFLSKFEFRRKYKFLRLFNCLHACVVADFRLEFLTAINLRMFFFVLHIEIHPSLCFRSCMDTDYFSDSSDTPSVLVNADLVKTVRRNLVYCLKELLQFAVVPSGGKESSSAVSPFNCFSGRSARLKRSSAALAAAHIWQLFLAYYEIKHGNDYVHTPARKLTDAFKLDNFGTDGRGNISASSNCVVGGGGSTGTGSNSSSNIRSQAITAKQTLLTAIYDIGTFYFRVIPNYRLWFNILC